MVVGPNSPTLRTDAHGDVDARCQRQRPDRHGDALRARPPTPAHDHLPPLLRRRLLGRKRGRQQSGHQPERQRRRRLRLADDPHHPGGPLPLGRQLRAATPTTAPPRTAATATRRTSSSAARPTSLPRSRTSRSRSATRSTTPRPCTTPPLPRWRCQYADYSDLEACYAGTYASPAGTGAGERTVTNGNVPDSDNVTFDAGGTFRWIAYYSGDANNDLPRPPASTETLIVDKRTRPCRPTPETGHARRQRHRPDRHGDAHRCDRDATGTITFHLYFGADCSTANEVAGSPVPRRRQRQRRLRLAAIHIDAAGPPTGSPTTAVTPTTAPPRTAATARTRTSSSTRARRR